MPAAASAATIKSSAKTKADTKDASDTSKKRASESAASLKGAGNDDAVGPEQEQPAKKEHVKAPKVLAPEGATKDSAQSRKRIRRAPAPTSDDGSGDDGASTEDDDAYNPGLSAGDDSDNSDGYQPTSTSSKRAKGGSSTGGSQPNPKAAQSKRKLNVIASDDSEDSDDEDTVKRAPKVAKPASSQAPALAGKTATPNSSPATTPADKQANLPHTQASTKQTPKAAAADMAQEIAKERESVNIRIKAKKRTPESFGSLLNQQNKDRIKGKKPIKYTPLEEQVIGLKQRYPDTVLAVEVGYKYQFFGEDAKIASTVLNIMCYPKHAFMSASFPTTRLTVHLRRLVDAGHKVGVIGQSETAALKKASSTANKGFARELKHLYTKSTLIGEGLAANHEAGGMAVAGSTNYLLCMNETEDSSKPMGAHVAFVAVSLSTGECPLERTSACVAPMFAV